MRNRLVRRVALASTAALLAIGLTAPAALAVDFYVSDSCVTDGGTFKTTAYDTSGGGTDKKFHHGIVLKAGWSVTQVSYGGYPFPNIPWAFFTSGTKTDGYVVQDSTTTRRNVSIIVKNSYTGATDYCLNNL